MQREDVTKTIPEIAVARRERRGQPRLRIVYSPGSGHQPVLTLPTGSTIIGRRAGDGQECLSFANDSGMSSVHAKLTVDPASLNVRISDWGSKNGTHVGGALLRHKDQWHDVADGTVLRLGNTVAVLRYEPSKPEDAKISALLGTSLAMKDLRVRIGKIAPEEGVYVLITGETGTGKELVAQAIHDLSPRSGKPFVALNCAAIAESLAESQLFGHVAKAFNDAVERQGCFRSAQHGTLFLDEIGDMPLALQPKLFRALQERAVTPVGADRPVPCDVRVVCATNQNLQADIAAGQFRPELFSRLAQVQIDLLPLRQRPEDIVLLLRHFYPQVDSALSPDLVHALLRFHWPQNVRQLYNVAVQLRIEGVSDDLWTLLRSPRAGLDSVTIDADPEASLDGPSPLLRPKPRIRMAVPTAEQLTALLQKHGGTVAHVAEDVGCSRRQIQRWMELHSINPDTYRT